MSDLTVSKDAVVVADTKFLGREIVVYTYNGEYFITNNGCLTQPNISADGVIGYLCNAMMNAKT